MMRGLVSCLLLAALVSDAGPIAAQSPPRHDTPVFRSGVDLVSVAAVVRDKHGRAVRSLAPRDFELLESGRRRPILHLQADEQAPASVAFLIDGSGSMRVEAGDEASQRISDALLKQLDPARDDAALLTFDTRLVTLCEFTSDFDRIREGLAGVESFGATSLYDAIAGTAAIVAERTQKRRAVVVVTDGDDNASAYAPDEVSWIASTIDVPVYVFAVGGNHDERRAADAAPSGALEQLARATGGEFYRASTPTSQQLAAGRLMEELRYQYLIAFEPSSDAKGLRSLEVRTRSGFKVRARQWYSTGS